MLQMENRGSERARDSPKSTQQTASPSGRLCSASCPSRAPGWLPVSCLHSLPDRPCPPEGGCDLRLGPSADGPRGSRRGRARGKRFPSCQASRLDSAAATRSGSREPGYFEGGTRGPGTLVGGRVVSCPCHGWDIGPDPGDSSRGLGEGGQGGLSWHSGRQTWRAVPGSQGLEASGSQEATEGPHTRAFIPALPPPCCVTLDKSFSLSGLYVFHLYHLGTSGLTQPWDPIIWAKRAILDL